MIWETFPRYARKTLPHTKSLPDHEPGIGIIARNARAGSSGPALPRAQTQPPVPPLSRHGPYTTTITPPAITAHTTTDQRTQTEEQPRSLPLKFLALRPDSGVVPVAVVAAGGRTAAMYALLSWEPRRCVHCCSCGAPANSSHEQPGRPGST